MSWCVFTTMYQSDSICTCCISNGISWQVNASIQIPSLQADTKLPGNCKKKRDQFRVQISVSTIFVKGMTCFIFDDNQGEDVWFHVL